MHEIKKQSLKSNPVNLELQFTSDVMVKWAAQWMLYGETGETVHMASNFWQDEINVDQVIICLFWEFEVQGHYTL